MTLTVIGGTGLANLDGLEVVDKVQPMTPWGPPSAPIVRGHLDGAPVAFLARHGEGHSIAPHKINYRANLWALNHLGLTRVVAVAAVGGIDLKLKPADLSVPNQLIDYTWGRGHTFFADEGAPVVHIDFTSPYDASLRELLRAASLQANVDVEMTGVYGTTQGPRLETAAEIERMERDGCTLVGMTGMPEAALARELGMGYAHLAVIVNEAAGKGPATITMEDIERNVGIGMAKVRDVIRAAAVMEARASS